MYFEYYTEYNYNKKDNKEYDEDEDDFKKYNEK